MKVIINKCFYCGSTEGAKRPIGNYIVELKELRVDNVIKLACQSCYVTKKTEFKKLNKTESDMKKSLIKRLKNIFFLLCIAMIFSVVELNQRGLTGLPGLPDSPDLTPIDAGLGLLVAAGVEYAHNKNDI